MTRAQYIQWLKDDDAIRPKRVKITCGIIAFLALYYIVDVFIL